jgi:hypothetical protein
MKIALNKTIALFFSLITVCYISQRAVAKEKNLNIVRVDLDDEKTMWPEYYLFNYIEYKKLNKFGVPESLTIFFDPLSISFNFKYVGNDSPKFRYKLLGYENNWHYTDSLQSIRYTKFKQIKYTFQIQALVNNKIIEEDKFDFIMNHNFKLLVAYFISLCISAVFIIGAIKIK